MYMFDDYDDDGGDHDHDDVNNDHRRLSYNTSTSISLASSFVSSGSAAIHYHSNTGAGLVDSNATIIKEEEGTVSNNSLFDGISNSNSQRQIKLMNNNNCSGSTPLLLNDIEEDESLEIDDFGRIVRSVAASRGAASAAAARYASPRTLRSDFSTREREQLRCQHQNSIKSRGMAKSPRDPSVIEDLPSSPSPAAASAGVGGASDPEHTPEVNSYQSNNNYYYDGSTISGSVTYAGTLSASTITFDNGGNSNTSSIPRRAVIPHLVSIPSSNDNNNKQRGTKVVLSNLPKTMHDNNMEVIHELVEDNNTISYHERTATNNVDKRRGRRGGGGGEQRNNNVVSSTEIWKEDNERHHHTGIQRQPTSSSKHCSASSSTKEWARNGVASTQRLKRMHYGGKDDPPEKEGEDSVMVAEKEVGGNNADDDDVYYKPRPPLRKPHEAKSRETMVGRGKSTTRSIKSRSTTNTTTTSRSKNEGVPKSRSTSQSRSTTTSRSGDRTGGGKHEDNRSRSSNGRWGNDVQSRSTTSRSGGGQVSLDRKSSSSSSSRRSIIEDRLCRLNEVQRSRNNRSSSRSKNGGGQSRSSRSGQSEGGRMTSSSSSRRNRQFRDTRSRSRSSESKSDWRGGDNYDNEYDEEEMRRSSRQRQSSRRSWNNTDRYDEDYGIVPANRYHRNSLHRFEDAPSYYSVDGGGGASVQSYSTQGSVRRDIDDEGYCLHHPDIQLMKLRRDDTWRVLRKRCPECLKDISSNDRRHGFQDRSNRPRSYSGSANTHHTPLESDSVDTTSSPSLDPFNGMGLKFQTPEEREAEEATNRLKRRLAARAYHFPGNTWCQDWMQYISNTHTVLGLFFHHPLHPMGFQERLVMLFGSIAIGLTISNFTYMYFIRNGFSVKDEVLSIQLKGVPEIGITKLMLVLWTLGSFLHTVFDLLLWHLKACTVCRYRGRIDDRLMKWGRVAGLFIVMVTIGAGGYAVLLRASIEYDGEGSVADEVEESILSNELYEIQYDDKRSFGFLFGYLIEFLLALFVYYPIAITVLFSGVLGCSGRVPILGGRPREMKKEERYELSKRRPRILKAGKATEEDHNIV